MASIFLLTTTLLSSALASVVTITSTETVTDEQTSTVITTTTLYPTASTVAVSNITSENQLGLLDFTTNTSAANYPDYAGSVVAANSLATTIIAECTVSTCDFADRFTIIDGPSTFSLAVNETDASMSATLTFDCQITGARAAETAVCTMSQNAEYPDGQWGIVADYNTTVTVTGTNIAYSTMLITAGAEKLSLTGSGAATAGTGSRSATGSVATATASASATATSGAAAGMRGLNGVVGIVVAALGAILVGMLW
ncbi:hypothetical protein BO70DRAFT_425892 [Aspergillus heteromorphus CBS 117.55]|uniref:GPI anchored cell wall protein n=1 Tax=Aspergillus heteromorphus CBS 117.55 TaxID=1448321 RepID=A0A317WX98_9EURO|nr:uncharacterized protein BO70DRAFT_425892 [Aspergillus heteromorphus CBS 117.55]PWY90973.1 hypothetical protein BO70DRAFT_425892 [Aspergillus heteromorphus CBS 117.55]